MVAIIEGHLDCLPLQWTTTEREAAACWDSFLDKTAHKQTKDYTDSQSSSAALACMHVSGSF